VSVSRTGARTGRLLNLGCGGNFHGDWINLDASPVSPEVIACDITGGLPFDDASFDAVYGSHVLEHLEPEVALGVLRDCHRILKPGGILRIAVPDLEAIARLYVSSLESAIEGDVQAQSRYDWIMLELYDQTVRSESGGAMAGYLSKFKGDGIPQFVAQRVGTEGASMPMPGRRFSPASRLLRRLRRLGDEARQAAATACTFAILGRRGARALRTGLFRSSGEVHQWMYDRFSLARALHRSGFESITGRHAGDSDIAGFADDHLEVVDGRERKPDSLYMEARKPAA
jgi:hypothetical protein